jgi:hypothetical protein
MSTVNANVRLGYQDASWFTTIAAVVLLSGQIVYRSTDGQYKIGDGVSALSALTFYGGVSSGGLTVGTSTITSGTNTRILYNNNGVLGEYLVTGTGTTAVLSTSPTFTTSILSPLVTGVSGALGFSIAATATGALINYNFTTAAHTNQTLSTNIPNFKVNGSTKQWATGLLGLQEFNTFTSNTISFVGASTTTLAANMSVAYVQGGTNATITTSAAIYVPTLALTNTTTGIGLYVVAPSGAGTNLAAQFDGSVLISSATSMLGALTVTGADVSISASRAYILIANSGNASSRRWQFRNDVSAFGDFKLMRSTDNTSSAGTTVVTWDSSSNMSLVGNLTLADATNIIFNTSTGSKIGTATTQKIGFWNATPIVQPTTAVTAATFVANVGANIKQDSTFDGYTVEQVVKALRNIGLLA